MRNFFSLAGLIGLLFISPANAALIYDSITGTTISSANGGIFSAYVGNSFQLYQVLACRFR